MGKVNLLHYLISLRHFFIVNFDSNCDLLYFVAILNFGFPRNSIEHFRVLDNIINHNYYSSPHCLSNHYYNFNHNFHSAPSFNFNHSFYSHPNFCYFHRKFVWLVQLFICINLHNICCYSSRLPPILFTCERMVSILDGRLSLV